MAEIRKHEPGLDEGIGQAIREAIGAGPSAVPPGERAPRVSEPEPRRPGVADIPEPAALEFLTDDPTL